LKITKQQLINKGLTLIPVSEIDIKLDPDERIGYDFTVEDYYTFATDDGVFVQDCMALYFPITEKSIKDAKTKIGIWNNLISQTDITLVPQPSQDIILGIFSVTQ
jgi:hypothetical protein